MRKVFIFIVVLYCSLKVQAQNSNENTAAKKAAVQSLNQVFSANVLQVYQDNSKSKIEDLFSYFQLLTDASLTDDLKKEVVKNINLLYKNQNELVIDFTSESMDDIPLQQFIQKLLISEPILFTISKETKFNSIDSNSWKSLFTVARTKSGIVKNINVNQKVYFTILQKIFGGNSKEVWVTYLGEMK